MPDDLPLIRNGDRHLGVFFQDDTLTAQPALQPRVDGAIDKIFFLVGNLLQEFLPFLDVHVAGGTGAHAAAVVVQMHVVVLRDFEDGHVQKIARRGFGRDGFIFKLKMYGSHGGMWSMWSMFAHAESLAT